MGALWGWDGEGGALNTWLLVPGLELAVLSWLLLLLLLGLAATEAHAESSTESREDADSMLPRPAPVSAERSREGRRSAFPANGCCGVGEVVLGGEVILRWGPDVNVDMAACVFVSMLLLLLYSQALASRPPPVTTASVAGCMAGEPLPPGGRQQSRSRRCGRDEPSVAMRQADSRRRRILDNSTLSAAARDTQATKQAKSAKMRWTMSGTHTSRTRTVCGCTVKGSQPVAGAHST